MELDPLSASLIGHWIGTEKKIVYTSSGDGCYPVERTFIFSVEFAPAGMFSGTLSHTDSDDCGFSKRFTGKWKLKSGAQAKIEAVVDQTCYNEEKEIKGPIAVLTFSYQDGSVSQVTIDDSQSEIFHEEHCDDIHFIVCKRQ
ncbi:hypothetical protein M1146_04035 [Patescibacteria group bacterium]|nr:hypothetical protein [Patescibacteria group bacterium]